MNIYVSAFAILMIGSPLPAQDKSPNWLHFSVLGIEQAGASSTKADQRLFYDFFVTRFLRD